MSQKYTLSGRACYERKILYEYNNYLCMLIVNIWPSFHFITKVARPTRLDEKQIVHPRLDLALSGRANQRCDLAHGALSNISMDGRGRAWIGAPKDCWGEDACPGLFRFWWWRTLGSLSRMTIKKRDNIPLSTYRFNKTPVLFLFTLSVIIIWLDDMNWFMVHLSEYKIPFRQEN